MEKAAIERFPESENMWGAKRLGFIAGWQQGQQEGWIDVKDRLPEDLEDVLMTHQDFGGIVIGYYCYDHERWIDNSATDKGEQIIITHWMPLPSPPLSKT